jgi:ABC-type multidrug transport system ATPase subunit
VGSGKTELTRGIFGADKKIAGEIRFAGQILSLRQPRDAVKLGLGYVPEDRDSKGLCLNLAVRENLGLATLVKLKGWLFDQGAEQKLVRRAVSSMRIRTRGPDEPVKYLSGGNKQKVVLGKWLAAQCKLLLLDEPTTGIDVGARQDIYRLIEQFREAREHAVILVSGDIDEVLEIADRILVLADYRAVAELDPARTDKHQILEYCTRRAAANWTADGNIKSGSIKPVPHRAEQSSRFNAAHFDLDVVTSVASFSLFFTASNFWEITLQTAVIGIIAAGQTLVILSGGIDLSVDSVFACAGIVGGLVFQATGNLWLTLAAPLLTGAALGSLNSLI